MRPKSKTSPLLPHSFYTRVDVEPKQERVTMMRAHSFSDKSSRLVASMQKRVLLVAVFLGPAIFLWIWHRLFAINVSSALAESRGVSSVEKTFTVR